MVSMSSTRSGGPEGEFSAGMGVMVGFGSIRVGRMIFAVGAAGGGVGMSWNWQPASATARNMVKPTMASFFMSASSMWLQQFDDRGFTLANTHTQGCQAVTLIGATPHFI